MIVLGFLLGLVIILQAFILIGICRKNFKLDVIATEVSRLSDLIVPAIGANMENYAHIVDQLNDAISETSSKKKHKKKHKKMKGKIYADNTIIKTEMKKGAKFL